MAAGKLREVSVRRMKPTDPVIDIDLLLNFAHNWKSDWEADGSVQVFDEGIAQYLICGKDSHHKFYASLLLGKACLRCSLADVEPEDDLDDVGNRFRTIGEATTDKDCQSVTLLKDFLAKRGYKFD